MELFNLFCVQPLFKSLFQNLNQPSMRTKYFSMGDFSIGMANLRCVDDLLEIAAGAVFVFLCSAGRMENVRPLHVLTFFD